MQLQTIELYPEIPTPSFFYPFVLPKCMHRFRVFSLPFEQLKWWFFPHRKKGAWSWPTPFTHQVHPAAMANTASQKAFNALISPRCQKAI